MRKLLLLLLSVIFWSVAAQAQIRDTIVIHMPPFSDTTCINAQIKFTSTVTSDTFTGLSYKWFINGVYQGITADSFPTTAPRDGDDVWCKIYFRNSFGVPDSSISNVLRVYRHTVVPARVMIAIVVGTNPDCPGHGITFRAYPISGGYNPRFQWRINGRDVTGADSSDFSRIFGGADTISCRMVADSFSCSPYDTAYSIAVPIIHIRLRASLTITSNRRDTICDHTVDTFRAIAANYGYGATYQWYRDSVAIVGATNPIYVTDTLRNGDTIYCVLTSRDSCVVNPVVFSDTMRVITVIHNRHNTSSMILALGSNPGCLDSPTTFRVIYDSFGITVPPYIEWRLNGTPFATGSDTVTRRFLNSDVVSALIRVADGGCYEHDSIAHPGVLMVRYPTPITPWLSLIHNRLVADSTDTTAAATYRWYYGVYPTGVLIPGATGPNYHPVTLGNYYCMKDSLSCPSGPSNVIYISLLDLQPVANGSYSARLFPNPTTGMLSVEWDVPGAVASVAVCNAVGTTLLTQKVNNTTNHEANLSHLPDGIYFVVLKSPTGATRNYRLLLAH